jgi:hypothetical protein
MGVALGWIALALAGVAAAPRTEQPDLEICYTVRFVETEGLGWRTAVFTRLTPVTRQGAATVWTAPRSVARQVVDTALKAQTGNVLRAPRVTARSGSPAHVSARANQQFVTQVAWDGDDRAAQARPETVRTGSVATMAGRKLDQGILVQLVLEDTEIRAIHHVNVPCPKKSSGCTAQECPGTPTTAVVKSQVFMGQGKAAGMYACAHAIGPETQPAGCCEAGEEEVLAIGAPGMRFPQGTLCGIRFEGNVTSPVEKLSSQLVSRVGQPIDQRSLIADVKSLLAMKRFSNIQIDYEESPPGSGRFIVTFAVREKSARAGTTTKPACATDCTEASACCPSNVTREAAASKMATGSAGCDCVKDGVVPVRVDSVCCASSAQPASCTKESAAGTVALEVPEIGSQEIAGEWLIPKGGILLVSFGPHTVTGKDGKPVIHERLAILEAEEAPSPSVDQTINQGSSGPIREATPLAAPRAAMVGLPPAVPAPMAGPPVAIPALPSRSIPQGFHSDGRPADLPPLPPEEAEDAPDGSSEAQPSPQTRKSQRSQPQSKPKPAADSGTTKAGYAAPTFPATLPGVFLSTPSVGLQFLIPLKPLSLRLPFNRKLELEIFGRVVRNPEPVARLSE